MHEETWLRLQSYITRNIKESNNGRFKMTSSQIEQKYAVEKNFINEFVNMVEKKNPPFRISKKSIPMKRNYQCDYVDFEFIMREDVEE